MIEKVDNGYFVVTGVTEEDKEFFQQCQVEAKSPRYWSVAYKGERADYIGGQYWVAITKPDGEKIIVIRAPGLKGGWRTLADIVVGTVREVFGNA